VKTSVKQVVSRETVGRTLVNTFGWNITAAVKAYCAKKAPQ
jgi:hypothetical protein